MVNPGDVRPQDIPVHAAHGHTVIADHIFSVLRGKARIIGHHQILGVDHRIDAVGAGLGVDSGEDAQTGGVLHVVAVHSEHVRAADAPPPDDCGVVLQPHFAGGNALHISLGTGVQYVPGHDQVQVLPPLVILILDLIDDLAAQQEVLVEMDSLHLRALPADLIDTQQVLHGAVSPDHRDIRQTGENHAGSPLGIAQESLAGAGVPVQPRPVQHQHLGRLLPRGIGGQGGADRKTALGVGGPGGDDLADGSAGLADIGHPEAVRPPGGGLRPVGGDEGLRPAGQLLHICGVFVLIVVVPHFQGNICKLEHKEYDQHDGGNGYKVAP